MEILLIIPLFVLIILDIVAIHTVLEEDIIYSKTQKCCKVLLIFMLPFIGAIYELYLIGKYYRNTSLKKQDDVKWYAFWDYYFDTTPENDYTVQKDSPIDTPVSSSQTEA